MGFRDEGKENQKGIVFGLASQRASNVNLNIIPKYLYIYSINIYID